MINKMFFWVATFFMGLLAIGFIIFMIGVLFSNFSLMVFGMGMLLTAYGFIIGLTLLCIVYQMFNNLRSI